MADANSLIAWAAIVGAILSPVAGILVAIITYRRSKRASLAEAENTDKQLDIKEKDVDTHYWASLVEGFSSQVSAQQQQLDRQTKQIQRLEENQSRLETRLDADATEKQEMLAHIMFLEQLVPNPPGAPKRPWL